MHRFHDAEVDADHDLIISHFDALCGEACWSQENRPSVQGLIGQLRHYLSSHFEREEALMAAKGYPELISHGRAHAAMREEFARSLEPMLTANLTLREDLRLLRDMFLAHIVTWDDAFGAWQEARVPRPARPAPPARIHQNAPRISVDIRLGITIICPEGKITLGDGDQELAEVVRTQLEAGARKILLDFSHVTYLDSSGLGELVGCYTSIRHRGGDLKLCGLSSRVFSLMKLTSLHSVFDVKDTEAQALAAF